MSWRMRTNDISTHIIPCLTKNSEALFFIGHYARPSRRVSFLRDFARLDLPEDGII